MSGIVGLVTRDGKPVQHTELEVMLTSLAHRGPDGAGLWYAGPAGLGHCMLWTTPESLLERLPLVSPSGHLVLTADARIDNRAELIHTLALWGRPAAAITDSHLILAAYEKWGERCPEYLLGDFAFALWDARQRRLFCARDHMGIKPFYYYYSPRLFACASELKALFCRPDVPRRINDVRVVDHLIALNHDHASTFYTDLWRLPPGHSLLVTPAGIRLQTYWALDLEREVQLASDAAYAERFRELFTEAVRCRLRSAYPIGSVFSGGLDSSCVTGVARTLVAEHDQGPLHTLSAFFTGAGDTDERPFIDAIVAQGGLVSHRLDGNHLGSTGVDLAQILWHVEEPFWYSFLLVFWGLYRVAHAHRVRVLLDGHDGDSTVADCHQAYLGELLRTGQWRMFAAAIHGTARYGAPSRWQSLRSRLGLVKRSALEPLLFTPLRQVWEKMRGPDAYAWPSLINPDLARRVHLTERLVRKQDYSCIFARTARRAHYHSLVYNAFPFHLEMLNKAATAFSLEYRHPFFDKRLVEFCLALPATQKFHQGQTRAIMRRALADVLPETITQRPGKGSVRHYYVRALLTVAPTPLGEVIQHDVEDLAAYVRMATIRELYHGYLTLGHGGVLKVWYTAILALWLHQGVYNHSKAHPPGKDTISLDRPIAQS